MKSEDNAGRTLGRKPYERPCIVFTRQIEAVGGVCSSTLSAGLICRSPSTGCTAVFG